MRSSDPARRMAAAIGITLPVVAICAWHTTSRIWDGWPVVVATTGVTATAFLVVLELVQRRNQPTARRGSHGWHLDIKGVLFLILGAPLLCALLYKTFHNGDFGYLADAMTLSTVMAFTVQSLRR